jgi:hypothetical protein
MCVKEALGFLFCFTYTVNNSELSELGIALPLLRYMDGPLSVNDKFSMIETFGA